MRVVLYLNIKNNFINDIRLLGSNKSNHRCFNVVDLLWGNVLEFALFYPPSNELSYNVPPLGLLAISSYIEMNSTSHSAPVWNFIKCGRVEYLDLIQKIDWAITPIVGVTIMSTDVASALLLAKDLKKMNPRIKVVAGGPHITLTKSDFLRRHSEFDLIVLGDGEKASLALLKLFEHGQPSVDQISKIPGVYTRTESGDIVGNSSVQLISASEWSNPFKAIIRFAPDDELTYTDRLGRHRKAISLVTSRGCPLACTFCSIIAMNDKKYRSLNPEQVAEWLVEQRNKDYFEHIYFLDADFLTSRARSLKWASAIANAFNDEISWSVQANVGHIISLGLERLKILKNSGLVSAELGLEAGNDRQLEFFNKRNFGKIATVNQSLEALSLLNQAKIDVGVDYIMFYPGLTMSELAENLTFLLRSGLVDNYDLGHYFNELILFPGTPLREYYEIQSMRTFDPDQLPDVRQFYESDEVLKVRDDFLNWYRNEIFPDMQYLRERLRQQALKDRGIRKSQLRLLELKLRHQPYHVLKGLLIERGLTRTLRESIEAELRHAKKIVDVEDHLL